MKVSKGYNYRQLEEAVRRGTRFLILNADDMGMCTGVTDGIIAAYEEGLVTDISMIQTMPDSERAAKLAVEKGLNVGVHIDLTRQKGERTVGRPLLGDEVPSLVDGEGFFLSSGEFRSRMLSGSIDLGEAEREIRCQVERALERGLDLTHIDSNEGVHNYYPEILRMVLRIAREHDLPIRWPNPMQLDLLDREGILTTDHINAGFYGLPAASKKREFLRFLDEMKPGITEFIFHPAIADETTRVLTNSEVRAAEMELLMDPDLPAELRERDIQAISFRELREKQRDMRKRGVGRLKAGSARVKITPPFPTQMGGYFDRRGLSQGVHDDLWARCLYLSDGKTGVILISAEILYLDAELVGEVRRRIDEMTGVPMERIMVFATHTHSGPEGHSRLAGLMGFFVNDRLKEYLIGRISACAVMAVQNCQYARMGYGSISVEDLSSNRHEKGGPIDDQLGVIRVEALDGAVLGSLVNFTAHPVIMNSRNLLYSSEYPGRAMSVLEEILGGEAVCLFANGACGNVTVRRRGARFSEVERVGNKLAGHALSSLSDLEVSREVRIGACSAKVDLPLRSLPSVDEARRQVEGLMERAVEPSESERLRGRIAKARGTLALSQRKEEIERLLGGSIDTEVQVISINDLLLIGVPGELFVEYALGLRADLAPRKTFVIGYCNDMVGYVVTPEAAEEGGYEAGSTLLDSNAGERIVRAAKRLASSR